MVNFKEKKINRENRRWTNSIEKVAQNLLLFSKKDSQQLFQITSYFQDSGKTSIAIDLAKSLGYSGKKTLLIDLSLSNPKIHEELGIPNERGVVDFLHSEKLTLEDVCKEGGSENLQVITIGRRDRNKSYLFFDNRVKDLLEECRRKFDMVIIDTPYIESTPLSPLVSRLVDGVILIVEGNRDSITTLDNTVRKIEKSGGRVIGVILNKEIDPIPSFLEEYFNL